MLTQENKDFLKDVYELDERYTEEEVEEMSKVIVKHNIKKIELIEKKLNLTDKLEKKES